MLRSIILGSVALSSFVVVACSSPAPVAGPDSSESGVTNANGKGTNNASSSSSSGNGATSDAQAPTTDGGTTPSGVPDGDACKAQSNGDDDACYTCCAGPNDANYQVANTAFDACACAPAACATQCGSYCSTHDEKNLDAACGTCLKSHQECSTQSQAACAADATCAAVDSCLDKCFAGTKGGSSSGDNGGGGGK